VRIGIVAGDEPIFTNRDRMLLMELSADARASLTRLAKVAGCSVATAAKLVDRLVRTLDIRFTLEIDMDRLGFPERHILMLKFKKKPGEEFLRDFFKGDTYAQDVYLTSGDFDLLVFAAADTPINYIRWETDLAANLSDYEPELRPSEFVFPQLGFVPLSDGFVDFIREEIRADKKDRQILRELNRNSRVGYRDLARLTGMNEDTIRYRIFKLVKRQIVRRFTIAVQNPGYGSLVAYFLRYRFSKNTTTDAFPQMRNRYMNEGAETPLINTYPMIAPISGSYRSFGMAFDRDRKQALYNAVKWHSILLKKEEIRERHALITKPIKGLLPLRNLDPKQYYRLIWT
jgi:DNA-binding Lrp family transcriptional regulator